MKSGFGQDVLARQFRRSAGPGERCRRPVVDGHREIVRSGGDGISRQFEQTDEGRAVARQPARQTRIGRQRDGGPLEHLRQVVEPSANVLLDPLEGYFASGSEPQRLQQCAQTGRQGRDAGGDESDSRPG